MKRLLSLVLLSGLCSPVMADNGVYSETSHAIGGALIAGTVTWGTDKFFPEQDRFWMGFGVSSAFGVLIQYHEYDKSTNTAEEALLDAGAHVIGAAIGAYLTDSYILTPVVKPEVGGSYVGLDVNFRF
ncbi:hypothetical protein [Shewanella sp. Isolate11]|uniref:hypothetical protein n=1 Tax=Shewanella sp. Isolate11 TaxID=2908530 RepID=UPI001EFEB007|nr:hypothetical protein [Shewanella sp. Isolate11]MCG9695555.1 hypothetical protein [Shewanella sp. Isolate11]